MMINQAVNAKLQVIHPTQPHITTVALTEIYEPPTRATPHAKSAVIFGHGQLDRSPCGTGISAAMATLYARGELLLGDELVSESIIGTRFRGQLLREVPLDGYVAVIPVFSGEAYITGMQQFVVDPDESREIRLQARESVLTQIPKTTQLNDEINQLIHGGGYNRFASYHPSNEPYQFTLLGMASPNLR